MGFQFVHLSTYARKPPANAREGRSSDFIFGEARREAQHSTHIAAPAAAQVVYGVPVEEVERMHNGMAASATTTTKAGTVRKIRADQHTLAAVVASHPATMDEVKASEGTRQAVAAWEVATVEWLKETYGDGLVSVVRHVDEAHPHVHAYILPRGPEMRAKALHPGYAAKAEAIAAATAAGEDAKAANKIGDAAYVKAMRQWQDRYAARVGVGAGLTRLGPRRRRLSRAEWQAERAAARAAAVAENRARLAAPVIAQAEAAQAEAAAAIAAAAKVRQAATAEREAAEEVARKAAEMGRQAAKASQRLETLGGRLWLFLAAVTGTRRRLLRKAVAEQAAAVESARQAERQLLARRVHEAERRAHDAERAHEVAEARASAADRQRRRAEAAEAMTAAAVIDRDVARQDRDQFRDRWVDAENRLQAHEGRIRQPRP